MGDIPYMRAKLNELNLAKHGRPWVRLNLMSDKQVYAIYMNALQRGEFDKHLVKNKKQKENYIQLTIWDLMKGNSDEQITSKR